LATTTTAAGSSRLEGFLVETTTASTTRSGVQIRKTANMQRRSRAGADPSVVTATFSLSSG
jgi:hypothetical protein